MIINSTASPAVGIDVAQRFLDYHVQGDPRDTRHHRVANTDRGIGSLIEHLQQVQPSIIVLEATGGLQRRCADALAQAGLPVAVVNPNHVRSFARALGQLAKTDRIDAKVLAEFGRVIKPRMHQNLPQSQRQLQDLVVRRNQIKDLITQEKNRLSRCDNSFVREQVEEALAMYASQVKRLMARIDELLDAQPQLRRIVDVLQTVPGVGPATAVAMAAQMPELGSLNRGQAASLAGLAPINRDSGTLRGKRTIIGGRRSVRTAIYMAALASTKFNPLIRTFYQRLLANGKPKMVALIACARKLLLILNTMIKENRPWRNLPQTA
jgi:transposase